MAQGVVASVPSNGTEKLTAEELHEILECEKIVRFRDAVLSGVHPRIRFPLQLNGKPAHRHDSSPKTLTPRPNPLTLQDEPSSSTPSAYIEDNHNVYNRSSNAQRVATGRSTGMMPLVGKAEINPILLEKSEDLIKAEIQLQRVRLERVLREQVEQRRLSQKASLQTCESLPDFDISEVLLKALTIVHPSTAPEAEKPVGDHASASDSFDENTFYSSQHDTPEQSSSSQEHKVPGEDPTASITLAAAHPAGSINIRDDESLDVVMADASSNKIDSGLKILVHEISPMRQTLQHKSPLGLKDADNATRNLTDEFYRPDMPPSRSGNSRQTHHATTDSLNDVSDTSSKAPISLSEFTSAQPTTTFEMNYGEPTSSIFPEIVEPAIIRTRDDVPTLAPQPARVSPLATARAPPIFAQSMMAEEGTPAQVTALRKGSAASSQDSSSKGTKLAERKKNKKKKPRKASGKQVTNVDTPESPYIKPEPRSPSPLGTVSLPRPLKRQHQTLEQGPGLNYDEPTYEMPREEPHEQVLQSRYKDQGPRRIYDQPDGGRSYAPREAEIYGYRGVGRDSRQFRRVVSQELYREPQLYREPVSPNIQTLRYSPIEPHPTRAVSNAVTERHFQEPSRYYRDLPPRASVRNDADRDRSRSPIIRERRSPVLMAPPPRLAPTRIVFDEFGNQYYAPAPLPVSSRQSVAPVVRPGEEDRTYERASLRPVGRSIKDLYEEDGLVYRRPSPSLPVTRRVLTQPEQEIDYRSYRQRDYSLRPDVRAPPPEGYVRVREPIERRQMSHFEEAPREFVSRVGSVRPEGARYGAHREYIPRVQSVRPEAISRDYTTNVRHDRAAPRDYVTRIESVRPEVIPQDYAAGIRTEPRREMAAQPLREFSARPNEPEMVRREYIPPRSTSYAPTRPVARRTIDEVEYMEKRVEAPQDIYMDDIRHDAAYR